MVRAIFPTLTYVAGGRPTRRTASGGALAVTLAVLLAGCSALHPAAGVPGGASGSPTVESALAGAAELSDLLVAPAAAETLGARPPDWQALTALVPDGSPVAAEEDGPSLVEAVAASPARRLAVPFRTQRDGSRWAGSNCGPAALAMVLESLGIVQSNDDLRFQAHTYQGTVGMRTGTALQHIAQVANDFGVPTRGLYEGDAFRRWTVDEVRAEVARGNPVVALVKYRLLPGREGAGVRFDHYIVLWDTTPEGFVYNDSAYPVAGEGYARIMSEAQLAAAMGPTMVPQQAVAFLVGS